MNVLKKVVAGSSIILLSAVAVADDSEREYLLSLYHGVSVSTEQLVEQTEQREQEVLAATETQEILSEVSFPIADYSAY